MVRFLQDSKDNATDTPALNNIPVSALLALINASNVTIVEGDVVPVADEEEDEHVWTAKSAAEVQEMFQLDMEAIKAGRNAALNWHNDKRNLHEGTGPMTLNKHASKKAQAWADKIAAGEEFGYDPENTLCGENVVLIHINNDLDYMTMNDFENTGEECVRRWYEQVSNYDFDNHVAKEGKPIGSFTQAIWKSSAILGVGISLEKDGKYIIVVCRYFQKGNIRGRRSAQIGALKNCD